jgi:hypothetical protein
MTELIFVVEEAPDGGYTARALGASIFTEADTWTELQTQIRDAVLCHFDEGQGPEVIRLHDVREEGPADER